MGTKIIDFTMVLDENTPVFPGDSGPEVKSVAGHTKEGWHAMQLLHISSHMSTHIDAPFHMLENGRKLDEFPLETLIGEAMVLDARNKEPDLSTVRAGGIVFLYTGQTEKAGTAAFFENPPEVSEQTARALIDKKVNVVGLDSYTIDNEPFKTHKLLLKHDILIVENLVGLKAMVGRRFQCTILPLKLRDADGAPCRVIGWLD